MSTVATEVFQRGESRFNMVGQKLPDHLHITDKVITQGLAYRLARYALQRLDDAGFAKAVEGWKLAVYTMDADLPPGDRTYSVRWKNDAGGYIEVCGIFTKRGWPTLDHGYFIGHE
ncbi:hypothetical protein [Pseudomonas sp. 460]|uniref:hypothetical protein n=1 Tax=Pseudomonas sp. 460 TaxID=2485142 RepID=UPI001047F2F1|nr:hypothetical protein [Pseudomonas sp. 460]TCV51365.1 hypothetical protein EDB99_10731 [Pseudomonas sp. 460]